MSGSLPSVREGRKREWHSRRCVKMKRRFLIAAALFSVGIAFGGAKPGTAAEAAASAAETGADETLRETEADTEKPETDTEQGAGEEDGSAQVASADEMAPAQDVVDEDMTPVYGDQLIDGTYEIQVRSSSSMFNITACELTVEDGEMTAVITLGGDGYTRLFMGTGEEAVQASEDEYISFVENEEGQQTYQVPVEALDMGIDCAAWSRRKEKWYDRTLVFEASSLPLDAMKEGSYKTAGELGLANGDYTIEVTLAGGSGRTTVESPAALTVKDGEYTVDIVFDSPYYDYMIVDDVKYERTNAEGNSAFSIPLTVLDREQQVIADTVAMSQPYEISYTLLFDSESIQEAEN